MSAEPNKPLSSPIVIAHRGASGERPEHTLAAYDLAIREGADVIEPDLVPTRDGYLVARHENEISGTTDVAAHPEFADRKTTKTIDGQQETGWFTEDFTLAELKTLRARERLPQLRSTAYDGQFQIPTLDEIITLAKQRSKETGRTIAIYPETKHPTYFASIGKGTDAPLVAALDKAGWKTADAPVFIQSFEVNNLKHLKTMTGIRLIQLVAGEGGPADDAAPSYGAMMTPAGLEQVATYAWGIGPDKAMLWNGDAPTTLVADAHRARLRVHPWTYRAENYFVRPAFRRGADPKAHGDVAGEIRAALGQGIDGFFTDFPQIGVDTRNAVVRAR
ncbi:MULTISPECIES: glycerophosphodiester phosphodiesterase [Sphingomonas]|uniref:glycerophosphodiester phosphodiesterase n=1 Tax=Sphingomonas zeae TaxID=1646122 RepID=A0A7Y6B3Y1_9SPHN|nr:MULTISPECIES: glycerophosphodiester phosphodiesterase [Sphingomonas]MDK8184815.1 glycerophosphodiester phosphodiesterase [Sphingomonas zeae]MDK8215536.1 glycerophosphodiester phosphodiesterase [Sphingomonas sp. UMB7805-LC452B]NUU46990.1 glycerophosphodiester phosphodiesterase [Sphingomonas zeae]